MQDSEISNRDCKSVILSAGLEQSNVSRLQKKEFHSIFGQLVFLSATGMLGYYYCSYSLKLGQLQ